MKLLFPQQLGHRSHVSSPHLLEAAGARSYPSPDKTPARPACLLLRREPRLSGSFGLDMAFIVLGIDVLADVLVPKERTVPCPLKLRCFEAFAAYAVVGVEPGRCGP
jgi:hypothetical protein